MDQLSAYSAVPSENFAVLKKQADRVSWAFHNDQLGPWYEKICKLTNKEVALPMNTGAEAVETAIKNARRWAYDVKGVAEIIARVHNFHGRTMAASVASNQRSFSPLLPGFKLFPYGDMCALKKAINRKHRRIFRRIL